MLLCQLVARFTIVDDILIDDDDIGQHNRSKILNFKPITVQKL